MKNKEKIEYYFTDNEIIKILCKKRAIEAKKVHDNHFLRNITKGAFNPNTNYQREIYNFFPPRNEWIRLTREERIKRNTNAFELNKIQLFRTVTRERKRLINSKGEIPKWLLNLNKFISDIKSAALDTNLNYIIPKPTIKPILKSKDPNEYRPICIYKLFDLIIIGQISKYLTYCFDPLFLDCSYAFRSDNNSKKSFNHHEVILDILKYKEKMKCNLYVSECDIKKFYDCVNHCVIIEVFKNFVNRAKLDLDITIDIRAIIIFSKYLDSFSFNKDVEKNENKLLKNINVSDGFISKVKKEELLVIGSNSDLDNLGIPQGGALSCLIANMILDYVDRKVIESTDNKQFYARYCDDMLIMHPIKDECTKLFAIYQNSLRDIKLISHKPKTFLKYGKEFWTKDLKSKEPYLWSQVSENNLSVPWLSFVGYQIRNDGLIRVRKFSIEKEIKKLVNETDNLLKVLKKRKKLNLSTKAISFRLKQRFISMSVSRVSLNNRNISMCWCAGFKVLKQKNNIGSQFKILDKNRERQLKRLENHLKKYKSTYRKSTPNGKTIGLKYYGPKFSYFNQFQKKRNER